MVTLTFLGTAGDDFVAAKQDRASGGILLRDGGIHCHINPGPGTLARAKQWNVNVRETTHVFTLSNIFHQAYDLGAVITAMTYNGVDRHGAVFLEEHHYTQVRRERVFTCVDKVLPLAPGKRDFIKSVEFVVTSAATKEKMVGIRFLFPKMTLGIVNESSFADDVAEKHKGSTVLILSVKHPTEGPASLKDAVAFAKVVHPKLVILTGFGVKVLENMPQSFAKEVQRQSRVMTVPAEDGLVIDLDGMLFVKNQRHLKDYA
jgi:hypothetical protein